MKEAKDLQADVSWLETDPEERVYAAEHGTTLPQASGSAADKTSMVVSLPTRPRYPAMPPDDSALINPDLDSDGSGSGSAHAAGASAGGRTSLPHAGPLIQASQAGDDAADGLKSPKVEQITPKATSIGEDHQAVDALEFPPKETSIGEDDQVKIPDLLAKEEKRAADREAIGADERAREVANEEWAQPGVPALIRLNDDGDPRRKRQIAWAVIAEGEQPKDGEKLRVSCGSGDGDKGDESEVVEMSWDMIQPAQVRL
eukprot:g11505.t1